MGAVPNCLSRIRTFALRHRLADSTGLALPRAPGHFAPPRKKKPGIIGYFLLVRAAVGSVITGRRRVRLLAVAAMPCRVTAQPRVPGENDAVGILS